VGDVPDRARDEERVATADPSRSGRGAAAQPARYALTWTTTNELSVHKVDTSLRFFVVKPLPQNP
jgi:hypothetical protein